MEHPEHHSWIEEVHEKADACINSLRDFLAVLQRGPAESSSPADLSALVATVEETRAIFRRAIDGLAGPS